MSVKSQVDNPLSKIVVPILVVLLIASAFLIGVLWTKISYLEKGASGNSPQATAQPATAPVKINLSQVKDLFSKDVIKFGDPTRKVLFVEVADASCPFCHIAAGKNPELNRQASGGRFKLVSDGGTYVAPVPEIKKLVDQGKASFVYLYSPGHGAGEVGALALYCANEKGKFWEVHDKLMSKEGYDFMNKNPVKFNPTQVDISNGYKKIENQDFTKMVNFLTGIEIDKKHMADCLMGRKYFERLAEDEQLSASLGITGTPGFFVNENKFAGAYSWTEMKPTVDTALK
ncbi:MAG: DsbA family protein [Candidatus Blackburnbacteria bacterium]|nr:DsbA family protein [Candidatus Blackburnbacteria bacterium]